MRQRIGRRRFLHGAAAAALHGLRPARLHASEAARAALPRAATAFLGALDTPGRKRASFPFADPERVDWHYNPRRREGLPFKDMLAAARAAAHELMKSALSSDGYTKATYDNETPVRAVCITRRAGPHMRVLKCRRYSPRRRSHR